MPQPKILGLEVKRGKHGAGQPTMTTRRRPKIGTAWRCDVHVKQMIAMARAQLAPSLFYQKFEQVVVLILTWLIAIVVVFAIWNLTLKILLTILISGSFDPTDYTVFQTIFGMIFTVIIALEFKRSLIVIAERRESVVQVRTVVLIALLAVVRKLLILDPNAADALHLFALAAAILALGGVYWLVRYSGREPMSHRSPVCESPASHRPQSTDSGGSR
jgi:uncharacterized membrane protein (DUF373 family)